jgi:hypothetical protein
MKLIGERFKAANYCGKNVLLHDAAEDAEVNAAFAYLQSEVDVTIYPEKTTWAKVRKKKNTVDFLDRHCRSERFHLVFFKCADDSCTCGKVRMPSSVWDLIIRRPGFCPFPHLLILRMITSIWSTMI